MAKKNEENTEATATEEKKPARPQMPSNNGVTRPRPGTATGRVWEIADELSKQTGQPAVRAEVLKAFEAEGGNSSTGATQYGRWRKFNEVGKYGDTDATAAATESTEDEATVEE